MKFPTEQAGFTPHALISTAQVDYSPLRAMHYIAGGNLGTTGTWVTANRAYYIPMFISRPFTVIAMGWENGTTVSGKLEAGIYTWEGKRLLTTGSVTQTGTSDMQVTDTPDTAFAPGNYLFAIRCDNTTATVMKESSIGSTQAFRVEGAQIQDLGVGGVLPETATFSAPSAVFYPLIYAVIGTLAGV